MTTQRTRGEHPSDLDLAAWADEPASAQPDIGAHVAACDRCRAELAELAETRAALALDPPMPAAEAFAAQRARILAAVGTGSRPRGRVIGRIAWLAPLAAAAAIAAIVLVGRTGGPGLPDAGETAPGTAADAGAALPVVAEAEAAAAEAAGAIAILGDPSGAVVVVPAEAIDEELLDAALAAAEPLAPPIAVERSLTTELLFAELPEDEQSAVLLEMASAELDF